MTIHFLARVLAMVLVLAPGPAMAAVLYVAPNGVDGDCGPVTTPCQTITQAIANAASGDRIVVGPGVYGDIDGDNAFSSQGEEPAQVGTGCDCVVLVNKRVTLESSAGAGATIIDAGHTDLRVMLVTVSGAVIGRRDHGFTLRGGFVSLVLDGGEFTTLTSVRVEDNILTGNLVGISTQGATGAVVTGNVITDHGFFAAFLSGDGQTFSGNVVAGSALGIFTLTGHHTISDNVLVENGAGIEVSPGRHQIRRNTITGHLEPGIHISDSGPGDYAGMVLTSNNIFDNDLGTAGNCGVTSSHPEVINVERNYWGRATGPGPDPGDEACGALDAVPFAPRAIAIANTAGR